MKSIITIKAPIINNEKVIFLKPQTYMNLSGKSVILFVNYFKIKIEDILVISDDLALPIGTYRLRSQGSAGGHNGLKNIEECLKSNKYKKCRFTSRISLRFTTRRSHSKYYSRLKSSVIYSG